MRHYDRIKKAIDKKPTAESIRSKGIFTTKKNSHNNRIVRVAKKTRPTKIVPSNKSINNKPQVYTKEVIMERLYTDSKNANRICIINQPSGLGDILFCEPIARTYYQQGYKIIWPVEPIYCNINKHFDYITFINKNFINIDYEGQKFLDIAGTVVVPLRFADKLIGATYTEHMVSKYKLWNLPLETWRTTCWKRDNESEKELYYDVLQLKDDENYNLISQKYLTDQSKQISINPGNGLKNVYVETISDYTLIDWSLVIEKATNIHVVSSAINYIIEFLDVSGKGLHLYAREPEKNFRHVAGLLKKVYITHE
jgi:hypothetical protein